MKKKFVQLYDEMLIDINRCLQMPLSETENVTSCFWIAKNYWEHLKRKIIDRPFKNKVEEINFFKNVKPKFTGRIQYFAILSEALLFIPENKEDQVNFWQKETDRYQWFCDKNRDFVEYYESGCSQLDHIYFTRMDVNMEPLHPLVTYDADKKFCSSHDYLVRGLLAHRMYREYVRKKLEFLQDGMPKV